MAKKTTPAERREYLKEREIGREKYKQGDRSYNRGGEPYGAGISFIDKLGNIIRPTKESTQAAMAKAERYNPRRHYSNPSGTERYVDNNEARRGYRGIFSVISILGGIFFLSPNLTGNAIGNMTTETASWIGAALIVIGIIVLYFLMRIKKRKNQQETVPIKNISKKKKR